MTLHDLGAHGLSSIENGVADFMSKDPKRISSALRNLYAGVLLLLKEKLRRESPPGSGDLLVYKNFKPSRTPHGVVLVAAGKNTVDFHEIKNRFEALDLALDWKRLDRLRGIRNGVEHFIPEHPDSMMKEAIANTFVLVAQVLDEHLELNPGEVLDQRVWATMLSEAETYKEMEDRCRKTRMGLEDLPDQAQLAMEHYVECPSCGSGLLKTTSSSYFGSSFQCFGCGNAHELSEVLPSALAQAFAGEAYEAAKDGGEQPIVTCPTCGADAFSVEEDRCLACEESRPYEVCKVCGESLSIDESDEPICSYHRAAMDKDD